MKSCCLCEPPDGEATSQLLSWFVPTKVSSSAKTHSPSQEQLGFFETWIDQNIQNSSQFYHHCSVSINWGLIIPSHPCLILLDACYIIILLPHTNFTPLARGWFYAPCFVGSIVRNVLNTLILLAVVPCNIHLLPSTSIYHIHILNIMPCFLPLVISHGCIFQLLLVELLLLDQPKYCSKLLNTLDKANIDVEPPQLANLSFGESIWHMCSTDSTVYKGISQEYPEKCSASIHYLPITYIVGFLPPYLWLEISPSYIVLTIRAFHHQISPWNHCFSTESNHFIWRIWECYCV